jgi:hypothetical protein
VGLLIGDGPVFDATGDDQELAFFEPDVSIPKLHPKPAFDDEKQFVFIIMVMPDERTLELDQLHLLAIQLANDLRLPPVAEQTELLLQVHFVHGLAPPSAALFSAMNGKW